MFFLVLVSILIHDFYFYLTHRMMHHKLIFKYVHKVHHNSTDPSTWAAFAFHPFEAVIEASIVLILVFIMPIHPLAIFSFLVYMTLMNVIGHLGFELFPKNTVTNPILKWSNTSTHHNMHHRYFNSNFGLYFNIWDKVFKTNHENYISNFQRIKK